MVDRLSHASQSYTPAQNDLQLWGDARNNMPGCGSRPVGLYTCVSKFSIIIHKNEQIRCLIVPLMINYMQRMQLGQSIYS
jgi:hypothetical protein